MKHSPARGFTLPELMIVVALIGVVLMLAGPSFSDFVAVQRLKSVNASLVTDVQFARSEAASRGRQVFMQFKSAASGDLGCYTIYVDPANTRDRCDCTKAPGSACPPGTDEIRTVQYGASQGVSLTVVSEEDDFSFHPLTGGIYFDPADVVRPLPKPFAADTTISGGRSLRVSVGVGGRPSVCAPSGSIVPGGYPAC
jgi:type IV fimbrial biogenesis protein FimT